MPSHFMTLVAAVCLVLLAAPVHGWWCNGHMLVAMIAQRHLKEGVSEKLEEITTRLSSKGPFPMIPDFVQLSCWSDDIKAEKMYAMGGWHYIDIPYNPDNIVIEKWPVEEKNVMTIIKDMITALKNEKASPYTVEFAIANLVHSYGDIHMPLHAAELFSAEYPKGDQGGNRINVFLGEEKMKLHALWDSICQGPQVDPPRPLSESNYDSVREFADYLEKSYEFTDEEKNELDASVFADESHELAKSVVYKGIKDGTKISDAYLKTCKKTAERRVALAGYRLATVLNSLFADSAAPKPNDGASGPVDFFDSAKTAYSALLRRFV